MRPGLLAVCVILLASAFCSAGAQSIQTIDPAPANPAIVDSVFTTDLDFDPGFGGTGKKFYDFNVSNHNADFGMRTFYRCEGIACNPYYYVVGSHFNGSSYDALVAKTDLNGELVGSWGTNGHMTITTGMSAIWDAAIDRSMGRFYFVGSQPLFSTTSQEFSVACRDIATGAACAGFGNAGGTELVVFDLGGSNNDVATRVLLDSDGSLYVGGYADSPVGYQVAVAKLNAASGALVNAFGGDGQVTVNFGAKPSGNIVHVFDMALSPATAPHGKELYLVGDLILAAGHYQGYLIGFDPASGAYVDSVGVGNGTSLGLTVTAVTVLANGDIAMAGTANTSVTNEPELLLVKLRAQGFLNFDGGFCGGGICTRQLTGEGLNHNWINTRPSAIAERPNTRDLVVGMQAGTWIYNFPTDTYSLTQKQVVQQYSASGMTLHASQQIEYPVNFGETAFASSAGMLVDSVSVMLTGSRFWSSSNGDYDITVTRLLANDSIFADQFGGPGSD